MGKRLIWLALLLLPALSLGQTDVIHWSAKTEGDAKPGATVVIDLDAKIDSGWHLYALPPAAGAPQPPNVPTTITADTPLKLAGEITQSKPIHKLDQNFGAEVDYFLDTAEFKVPVVVPPAGLNKATLSVRFQACNASTCIPPKSVQVSLGSAGVIAPAGIGAAATVSGPASSDDDSGRIAQAKQSGLLAFMGLAFGAGLLALLTPCVFPMVPITVSFFAKRREAAGSRGLVDAAAYCVGIIGAFTVFGILVTVLFGATGIRAFATNPWVNIAIGVLFVALALNLFGVYSISLPSGLANKVNPQGKSAGIWAPVLMGLTFTITSFTCTVPFVGTVLFSAAQNDLVFPFFGMLAFGTAFSLPFFLLALFPQFLAKMPKSGVWLESVKGFMGFLELAAAVKFFSNSDLVWNTGVFTRERFLIIWIVIGLASVAFLLGVLRLPHAQMPKQIGWGRAAVLLATVAAVGYLGFGVKGASLGELEAFLPPGNSGWLESYDKAQALAARTGKPIFINFTGVTCTNCRWMEKNMFPRQDVSDALKSFVTVELFTDREQKADQDNQLRQQKLTKDVTLPMYAIVTPDGQLVRKFPGSTRDPDQFVAFLKGSRVASK